MNALATINATHAATAAAAARYSAEQSILLSHAARTLARLDPSSDMLQAVRSAAADAAHHAIDAQRAAARLYTEAREARDAAEAV